MGEKMIKQARILKELCFCLINDSDLKNYYENK